MPNERNHRPGDATVVEDRHRYPVGGPLGILLLEAPPITATPEATEQIAWRRHAVEAQRQAATQREAWRAGLAARAKRWETCATVCDSEGETESMPKPPVRPSGAPIPLATLGTLLAALLLGAVLSIYVSMVIVACGLGMIPPVAGALFGLGGLLVAFGVVCLGAVVRETLRQRRLARGLGG